jgi:hypothetical protein
MPDHELVVVRTFLNNIEAEIAHSVLEAAGVEALIRSDDCGGIRPSLWLSGVALLVREDDVARAKELLDTLPIEAPDDSASSS